MTTAEKIKKIIAEHTGVDLINVHDDSHLADNLGADSLDEIEILIVIEQEFDLSIDDEDAERCGSVVKDIIAFVENLI